MYVINTIFFFLIRNSQYPLGVYTDLHVVFLDRCHRRDDCRLLYYYCVSIHTMFVHDENMKLIDFFLLMSLINIA